MESVIIENPPQATSPRISKEKSGQKILWETLWKIANSINHAIVLAIPIYICYLCYSAEKIRPFELHISFNILGYQLLMSEAIMSMSGDNGWTSSLSRKGKKNIHWMIGLTAGVLVIAGTSNFINSRDHHFATTHSKLGLSAMVFVVSTLLAGPLAYFGKPLFKHINPKYIKLYHRISGGLSFLLAMSALCYGFQKTWFAKPHSHWVDAFVALTAISATITMLGPFITIVKTIQRLFDS